MLRDSRSVARSQNERLDLLLLLLRTNNRDEVRTNLVLRLRNLVDAVDGLYIVLLLEKLADESNVGRRRHLVVERLEVIVDLPVFVVRIVKLVLLKPHPVLEGFIHFRMTTYLQYAAKYALQD